jgi:hypothetical protein
VYCKTLEWQEVIKSTMEDLGQIWYQKLLGSHDIEYECSQVSRAPCKEDPTVSAGKLIREQGGEQT